MTISPWLTFESIKELQASIANLDGSGVEFINIDDVAENVQIGALSTTTIADTAVGHQAIATGVESTAIGYQTAALASRSTAIGRALVTSTGSRSIAIGEGNITRASFSVCIGEDAGTDSSLSGIVVVGQNAYCESTNATMIGGNTDVGVNSDNSTALGRAAAIADNTANAIQLGAGTNSTAETLQFQSTPIANSSGLIVPGPFADDTAASSGGVGIGNPYYLPSGAVQVRLT